MSPALSPHLTWKVRRVEARQGERRGGDERCGRSVKGESGRRGGVMRNEAENVSAGSAPLYGKLTLF